MQNSFYTDEELQQLRLKYIGSNVKISRKSSIYNPECISINSNVRIDDFTILSGQIEIGSNIHISAYTALYGSHRIVIEDFCTISARVLIFSATDDYGGDYLTNPTIPTVFRNVISGQIVIKKHTIIGAGTIILPNVTIGNGVAVGAMSLVKENLAPWIMYAGIPTKKIGNRSKGLLRIVEGMWNGSDSKNNIV